MMCVRACVAAPLTSLIKQLSAIQQGVPMQVRAIPRFAARLFTAVFVVLVSATCEHNLTDIRTLTSITVTPNPVSVGTTLGQQFTAVGKDANGNVIPIVPVWSVDAGHAGGAILSSGGYTAPSAVGVGFDTVRATVGAIFGPARVNVTASATLVTITVTPNPASLLVGATQLFTAVGRDATNAIVPTPGLIWSVVNATAGTINSGTGSFIAGAVAGTYSNTIQARSGSVTGFASVIVSTAAAPLVPLGAAAPYGILAGTAITCINLGVINADVGVSPGNTLTGFGPCVQTGTQHLGDAVALAAQGSLTTAYNQLVGLPCGTAIVANLGGTTLTPGVYCTAST